jgi:Ti-type conjugative transfer relaxase TraA
VINPSFQNFEMRAYTLLCNFALSQATYLTILVKLLYDEFMANYHLTVKAVSRNSGGSCVASLAYRSASMLVDQRTGETHDYRSKENVEYVEIVVSNNAPLWIKELSDKCNIDREATLQRLSDIFEAAEKRKDAQVYREIEFALPRELSKEQNITWARELIHDTCVAKGMVAIMNYHFDFDEKTGEEKPHCHVLLSTRVPTESGFSHVKQRDWNKVELVNEWREQYAAHQNAALKEHGFEVRVDHRSNTDRGLEEIEPQPKRNRAILWMTERGLKTDKQSAFDVVRLKNQFKILKNPELVLSIVTSNHSTFTTKDIAKVLNRYIDDPEEFQNLYDRLKTSKELVHLDNHKGEEVFTTREMLRIEMSLVDRAESFAAQKTHPVNAEFVLSAIAAQNKKLDQHGGLSVDQITAIRHMLSPDQISCVVGFAGAGKTTSLEAAKEAWNQAGYKVVGLAPTGRAADNMATNGIRAMTVHRFLHAQAQGREKLTSKGIIVLDEAGMLDSRRFAELLSIAEKTGAKIIPMGDANQLQAVEAGPAFRLLTNRVKPVVLETIVRQKEDWQREATRLFGSLNTRQAIELYLDKGAFKTIEESSPNVKDTRSNTKRALIDAWARDRMANSTHTHIMLAFTNKDTSSLNEQARQVMREQGVLTGKDFIYKTCHLELDDFGKETRRYVNKAFARGDRLLFTRNDNGLEVKNGTLGTIVNLDQNKIVVKTDETEKMILFAPKLYPFIANGWATTIHKAQGVSVDHVKLLASYEQYRNLTYVGMSRHRHTLEVFGSSLDFCRPETYVDRLSRIQEKLSGVDYLGAKEIQAQLKADEKTLWAAQKLQQGRDLWNAIKVTTNDVLAHMLYDPKDIKAAREPYRSFDHSEEKRSSDLFTLREDTGDEVYTNQLRREKESLSPEIKVKEQQDRQAQEQQEQMQREWIVSREMQM